MKRAQRDEGISEGEVRRDRGKEPARLCCPQEQRPCKHRRCRDIGPWFPPGHEMGLKHGAAVVGPIQREKHKGSPRVRACVRVKGQHAREREEQNKARGRSAPAQRACNSENRAHTRGGHDGEHRRYVPGKEGAGQGVVDTGNSSREDQEHHKAHAFQRTEGLKIQPARPELFVRNSGSGCVHGKENQRDCDGVFHTKDGKGKVNNDARIEGVQVVIAEFTERRTGPGSFGLKPVKVVPDRIDKHEQGQKDEVARKPRSRLRREHKANAHKGVCTKRNHICREGKGSEAGDRLNDPALQMRHQDRAIHTLIAVLGEHVVSRACLLSWGACSSFFLGTGSGFTRDGTMAAPLSESTCQRRSAWCTSCCGLPNLDVPGETRALLVRTRTAEFAAVEVRSPEAVVEYRDRREREEQALPRHNIEIYVCPFLGQLDERGRLGCLIHPSRTGVADSQRFSFYGARVCADYDCRVKEEDDGDYSELLAMLFPESESYGQLAADHAFYSALQKGPRVFGRALEQPSVRRAFFTVCRARIARPDSLTITSFEVRHRYFADAEQELLSLLGVCTPADREAVAIILDTKAPAPGASA